MCVRVVNVKAHGLCVMAVAQFTKACIALKLALITLDNMRKLIFTGQKNTVAFVYLKPTSVGDTTSG